MAPPVADDAPRKAVLRVTAPPSEPYEITWGSQRGEVPAGEAYVDHAVPHEASDGDGIDASVEAGLLISDATPVDDVDLGAVLFVDGECAQCDGGSNSVDVYWSEHDGTGGGLNKTLCGTHRWGGPFPDPLSWVGL